MPTRMLRFGVLLLAAGVMMIPAMAEEDRWEPALRKFEAQDAKTPASKGGILFVGSSSIRMWNLEQFFPGMGALNRGFGGSMVSDAIKHFDRLVRPYAPKILVFYSGDNDIAHGKSAEEVIADYQTFTQRVWEAFPETRIVMLPIKASIARWEHYPKMKRVNEALQKQAEQEPRMTYVDVVTPMLGADGKPRAELFLEDGLHLNDAGYRIWTDLVMPLLKTPEAKSEKAAGQ